MTNSRTEYQREWRRTHPENIRKNKRKSYWNNPEKYRRRARDHYHKCIGSIANKKLDEMINQQSRMSPSLFSKLMYIKEHANEIYETQLVSRYDDISLIYDKVKQGKGKLNF